MSQYFSNIPRDFTYQRRGKQVPLEITGSVRRLDDQSNTQGNWNKLIDRTQDFHVMTDPHKQTEYRARMIDEIKRTTSNIFPNSEGAENDPVKYQRRVFPEQMANQNNTGGIINQLTREDADIYVPQKQIYNTQQRQSYHDEYMSRYSKKQYYPQQDLNYYSQIKTLPGQAYREGEEQKLLGPAEERNKGIFQLQQRSQITNLPGSSYGRVERQPEKIPNPELYKIRLQETTPEVYQNSNLTEYDIQRIQPHSEENSRHCHVEYDIIAEKGLTKKFPEKRDNLYRTSYTNEVVQPDTITGCRKKKPYNDPFHNHFQLG